MARYWCVNFAAEANLNHGLEEGMWMMQYQYSHNGFSFQERPDIAQMIRKNLETCRLVEPGDKFAAYLPSCLFYAIGEVTEPSDHRWQAGAAQNTDTVARTLRDRSHLFLDGVVRYSDAPAFYDDFTDPWRHEREERTSDQPDSWEFPQRIDVREWELLVPEGVEIRNLLSRAVRGQPGLLRQAIYEIPQVHFEWIEAELRCALADAEAE